MIAMMLNVEYNNCVALTFANCIQMQNNKMLLSLNKPVFLSDEYSLLKIKSIIFLDRITYLYTV